MSPSVRRRFLFIITDVITPSRPGTPGKPAPAKPETRPSGLVANDGRLIPFAASARPTCRYCVKVLKTMCRLGLNLELKNIAKDTGSRNALIEHGGKRQVPCLRIDAEGQTPRWLYESADIAAWLHREVGNKRDARLH